MASGPGSYPSLAGRLEPVHLVSLREFVFIPRRPLVLHTGSLQFFTFFYTWWAEFFLPIQTR